MLHDEGSVLAVAGAGEQSEPAETGALARQSSPAFWHLIEGAIIAFAAEGCYVG
jgi:hypothetical protein